MGNCKHNDGGKVCGKPTVGAGTLCAAHITSGKSESVVSPAPSTEDGVDIWRGVEIKRHYKIEIDIPDGKSGGGDEVG